MNKKRRLLKAQLLDERRTCDWCGEMLGHDTDMHEWLVKRHVLPGDSRVMDERNCALLHHACHMAHGRSTVLTQQLAALFVRRYGKECMLDFINNLNLRSCCEYTNLISRQEEWR